MDLDDKWIFYLHEAVTAGSVRNAADKLDINPSAISRQIAQLEAAVGSSLMERHTRGVRATEAGQLLLEYHRRRRADQSDTVNRIEDLKGLKQGHVSLAMGEGFIDSIASGPLSRFWGMYPSISLTVETASTNEVVRLVLEDEVQIGLAYNPPREPRLRTHFMARQPIRVIANAAHPLAQMNRPLEFSDIVAENIGQMPNSYGIRQIIDSAAQVAGFRITPSVTTGSIQFLRRYVEHGHGIALLPAFSVAKDIQRGKLVALKLRNDVLDASIHAVTRLGRELPTASTTALRQIGREFKRLEAADDKGAA